MTRADQLRAQHESLFAATRIVMLNTAVGAPEAVARRLVDLLR